MHVLGTAGHVDHGKSTLVERLTGIDPDRFAEEKKRGMTIDLGFAWLTLPSGAEVGIIDVPGHERFIKNMLSGTGGVSICLFVVAATEGWKPQSAEHLAILDVLGVERGVVALTKCDLVDPDTVKLVAEEIHERLEPSSLRGAAVIPCSAVTGEGMARLVAEIDGVVTATRPADDECRPRLWIDRVFTIAGSGTVVTGTLRGGSLPAGDEVEIAPEGRRARVRTIQSHKRQMDAVGPGNRVALNLAGLERQGAARGDVVVKPGASRATSRVDAWVRITDAAIMGSNHELTEKGAHLLYVGTAETPVRLKLLDSRSLNSGEAGFAQLHLRDPLPLTRDDRFVLRDAGRVLTLGGGVVLDPLPSIARRGDTARLRFLEASREADATDALTALVEWQAEVDVREALLRTGATEVPESLVQLGPLVVAPRRSEELQTTLRQSLERHHRDRPLEQGLDRQALRGELGLDTDAFAALLARTQDVIEEGAGIRLISHTVGLTDVQRQARDRIVGAISAAGFQPPLASELEADPALLRALVASDDLVKIDGFCLTGEQATQARRAVRAHIEASGPITVAQIRDLLDTTRKYAVPLCEWLDATGATLRRGDERILGPNP